MRHNNLSLRDHKNLARILSDISFLKNVNNNKAVKAPVVVRIPDDYLVECDNGPCQCVVSLSDTKTLNKRRYCIRCYTVKTWGHVKPLDASR